MLTCHLELKSSLEPWRVGGDGRGLRAMTDDQEEVGHGAGGGRLRTAALLLLKSTGRPSQAHQQESVQPSDRKLEGNSGSALERN